MTTYCLDHTKPFKARYEINTGTMPTKNVVRSTLTANLGNAGTTVSITPGEASLFEVGVIATIEQLNDEGKATAREVVNIAGISGDTLTIVRGYENCVMDDTANPKVLGNTPQSFTAGAKISVYISRALLNGVQVRLKDYNLPCNTCVYNQEMALTQCIANNCDNWRDALYQEKIRRCYNDCGFGDGSDGDCVMTGNVFLQANRNYNFRNLTICSGALVRFCGAGTPRINVQRKFCNMGTIDLRGGTFVGACSKVDCITGCTVSNNHCQTAYNALCLGCGGAGGYCDGRTGCNATTGCGGQGGKGGCDGADGALPSGYNGGAGATGGTYGGGSYGCGWGGGGGGGGYWTGNGGRGGNGGDSYKGVLYANGGNGGNGGVFGKGGDGGTGGGSTNSNTSTSSAQGGFGGNGYIGGRGGDGGNYSANRQGTEALCGGAGGNGIVCGGDAGTSFHSTGTRGHGGCAINNMYGLILHACEYYNNCIEAQGGKGGAGSSESGYQSSTTHTPGDGGCGANGGKVSIVYHRLLQSGSVNVAGGCGGKGGSSYRKSSGYVYGVDGANGTAGRYKTCQLF